MQSSALRPGATLAGRYELERETGSGSFPAFLARDLGQEGRTVVLRMLGSRQSRAAGLAQLRREFSVLRGLRHPNLARVLDLDFCPRADRIFAVEESVAGEALRAAAARWPAPLKVRSLLSVAGVVRHLHDRGLVHGRLNPDFIFASGSGDGLRVCGGGFASCLEPAGGRERPWSAPECILGHPASARSDLYALGVLACWLLSGRLPFEPDAEGYSGQKQLHALPDLSAIGSLENGKALARVLAGLLARDPERRPASGEEAARLLAEACGAGPEPPATEAAASLAGGVPFVGREEELRRLMERAALVRSLGRGMTVFVAGEPGIGKSRLMDEFRTWALLEGWRVVQASCFLHDERTYGPFRQVLERTRGAESAGVSEGLLFGAHEPAAGAAAPEQPASAGPFRDRLTREIVRRLSDAPTILLLHDFMRADEATAGVLDFLASDVTAHPILLCVSYRPEEIAGRPLAAVVERAKRHERGEVLRLEPLPREAVERMIRGVVGGSDAGARAAVWTAGRAGGNPFFAEEILRQLAESRILRDSAGGWRFESRQAGGRPLPESVRDVLGERISRLSGEALSIARWLAVLNRPAPVALLPPAAKSSEGEWSATALELVSRGLARTTREAGGDGLALCHDLVGEAIAAALPRAVKRGIHTAIAARLEQVCDEQECLQELAWHSMLGPGGAKSVRLALRAAEACRRQFAGEPARRFLEHALRNSRHLPAGERNEVLLQLAAVYRELNLPRKSIDLVRRHLRRLRGSVSPVLGARFSLEAAHAYHQLGQIFRCEEEAKKGLDWISGRADKPEIREISSELLGHIAFCRFFSLKSRKEFRSLERIIDLGSREARPVLKARLENLRAGLHMIRSEVKSSIDRCRKSLCWLDRVQPNPILVATLSSEAFSLFLTGRLDLSINKSGQALEVSKRIRSNTALCQAHTTLIEIVAGSGSHKDSPDSPAELERLSGDVSNPTLEAGALAALLEMRLRQCDYSGACTLVESLKQMAKHRIIGWEFFLITLRSSRFFLEVGERRQARERLADAYEIGNGLYRFTESQPPDWIKARILVGESQPGRALLVLNRLCIELRRRGLSYLLCQTRLLRGRLHTDAGRFSEARADLRYSLRVARAMPAYQMICEAHLGIGRFLIAWESHTGSHDRKAPPGGKGPLLPSRYPARYHLDEALRLCRERGFHELHWQALHEAARLEEKEGNLAAARDRAREALAVLDSLDERVPARYLKAYRAKPDRMAAQEYCSRLAALSQDGVQTEHAAGVGEEGIRALFRASGRVADVESAGTSLAGIASELIRATGMRRASVFASGPGSGALSFRIGIDAAGAVMRSADRRIAAVAEEVFRDGSPLLSADAVADERLTAFRLEGEPRIGTLMAGPLSVRGSAIGVLCADRTGASAAIPESLVDLFALFCRLASVAMDNILESERLAERNRVLQSRLDAGPVAHGEIVGSSAAMASLRERIALAAASPLDILITGESGTGKELVARAVHRQGRRSRGPFVAVDCGALTETLTESELFGHRKGAFTGAVENRPGLLESAEGGILFLDEIANLSPGLQGKMLRFLQEREFRRVGETNTRRVNIQVVAATNRDLLAEAQLGAFRKDLYYRLHGMAIRVPPLRERRDDIPLLVDHFLRPMCDQEGFAREFDPEAVEMLGRYPYPGNVRELKQYVQRAYYLCRGATIGVECLPPEVTGAAGAWKEHDETSQAIYRSIREGRGTFEADAKRPFMERDLSSETLRGIVRLALQEAEGRYREAFRLLGLPARDYAATIIFLKRHKCYLDFRPFRRGAWGSGSEV